MNADDLLEAVRDDNETALSRLGSSKSLYAATDGEMEADAVLSAAADAEHAASETFRAWAEDVEAGDGEAAGHAAEAFAATADEEADHYETVAAELADHEPGPTPAIQRHLRGLEGDVERAGGLLGRSLAARKSKEQTTGFFVGQADPQTADLFRDLRGDVDGQIERALDLLETVCEDDGDWERAREAAGAAIQVAYDEYTESLEAMGVNPKPVC